MSDHWNTYLSHIDREPASILLDLDPWENGEIKSFVHLFRLSVALKSIMIIYIPAHPIGSEC
ncbi:hypothetical protein [Cohnella caldifontis]|uniref:hypothetical protein n=1 Tax=Cohnella caldifontis TaxID=3027471 RepID=UPI0023EC6602|nr:hypothetical protein [Cohnella sp. YIM B05605]